MFLKLIFMLSYEQFYKLLRILELFNRIEFTMSAGKLIADLICS